MTRKWVSIIDRSVKNQSTYVNRQGAELSLNVVFVDSELLIKDAKCEDMVRPIEPAEGRCANF